MEAIFPNSAFHDTPLRKEFLERQDDWSRAKEYVAEEVLHGPTHVVEDPSIGTLPLKEVVGSEGVKKEVRCKAKEKEHQQEHHDEQHGEHHTAEHQVEHPAEH
ncbi:hypothetical protein HK104_003967 [Borealophlyctis nickersoniae]|nr:hypothetical protein HK104_003967 [Borealophlyctis nickersoniae]